MNYLLKKCYPGSPELGYISKPKGQTAGDGYDHYWNNTWFDPINYPEFWEEIDDNVYSNLDMLSFAIYYGKRNLYTDTKECFRQWRNSCYGNK